MEITVDRSIRLWWVFLLRGLLFIIVGAYIAASPVSGYLALSFLFGLIILLAGIAELIRAYQDHGTGNRGWHLFAGLVDLLLGLILVSHLAASMVVLRFIVGFYFLFKGITVLTYRRSNISAWWMVLGGLIILLFVILIWFNPVFGTFSVLMFTSLAFIVTGILNVMLGLRIKSRQNATLS
jgi:uncharacterized membrane protein HdeD (DUF308 family)